MDRLCVNGMGFVLIWHNFFRVQFLVIPIRACYWVWIFEPISRIPHSDLYWIWCQSVLMAIFRHIYSFPLMHSNHAAVLLVASMTNVLQFSWKNQDLKEQHKPHQWIALNNSMKLEEFRKFKLTGSILYYAIDDSQVICFGWVNLSIQDEKFGYFWFANQFGQIVRSIIQKWNAKLSIAKWKTWFLLSVPYITHQSYFKADCFT